MREIPFAFQCSIAENQLLPLKDSENGLLNSTPVTNIPEFEYYLRIYPNGDEEKDRGKTYIFLCLEFKNVKKVEADFNVTIESANFSKHIHYVYEKSYCWGPYICSTEELFDAEKNYFIDGKFNIKVNGIFKFENEDDALPTEIDNGQQKWIGGNLGDETWAKDDSKDFTIITSDGNKIKVHKFILSVRSEIFAAMFNSNMIESTENKVNIPDFSFKVVETGIKLSYDCNFISNLSVYELMSLLQFLDKYQLLSLKAKIESLLIDKISAATVCRLTNYSIFTNSIKLKEKCIEFLSASFVSKTPLSDIQILDKDVALKILENSFYKVLNIK